MPTDPTPDEMLENIYRRAHVIRRSHRLRKALIVGAALACIVAVPLALTGRSDQDDVDIVGGEETTTTDATTSTSTTAAATSTTSVPAPEATTPPTAPLEPTELPATIVGIVDARLAVISTSTDRGVRYLTPEGGPWILGFTSDGRSFVYYSQDDGDTCPDLYRVPIEGGPAETVVAGSDVGSTDPVVSRDGRTLAYSQYDCPEGATEAGRQDVVIRDLGSGAEITVDGGSQFEYPKTFDETGRRLLAYGLVAADEHDGYFIYDRDTGDTLPVEPDDGCTALRASWPTDGEIALEQDCGGDTRQLTFFDPSNRQPTRPTFELPERTRAAVVDRTGRWVAVTIADADSPADGESIGSTTILDLLSGEVVVAGLPTVSPISW